MIENLKAEKLKLTAELNESNDRATKATELKQRAEEEATRLNLMVQGAEMEKQILQQQVQTLTDMMEYFRSTTVKSVDEFISRLKLDLNLLAGG